jgi:hypothetical protein
MNRTECGLRSGFTLTLSFILLIALTVTGCATLGDIESANQRTQVSLNSFKKESRESQAELKKEIRGLRKEIKNLKNTDQEFDKDTDKIIKENQALRASLLGVTATLQGFLNAEKRRYEEGLRWIDNANKSMGAEPAKHAGANPLPAFPGAATTTSPSPPSETPAAATAPSPSPPSETPAAATAPSPSPPSETPAAATAPSPSPPTGSPVAVAAAASVTEEAPMELEEDEKPTIKIVDIVIDPPKVERKSKFTVTVKYDLEVNPDVPKLKYLETVVLLKGTLSIQNLKETVEREPGTNSYSRTIEVPADAPTGVYTIKGVVSSGSVRHSKIKTFLVK